MEIVVSFDMTRARWTAHFEGWNAEEYAELVGIGQDPEDAISDLEMQREAEDMA